MKKALFLAIPVWLTLSGCMSATPANPTIESQIVLQGTTSWEHTPYRAYPEGQPELTIQKLIIPANTALDWHSHVVPNAAYVLSGQLVIETMGGRDRIELNAGQALNEVIGTLHRSVAGDKPVELLVFYAGTPDWPLSLALDSSVLHANTPMEALLQTMAERLLLADQIAQVKWDNHRAVDDLEREKQVIANAQRQGASLNLPRDDVEQPLRAQIDANKLIQKALHRRWQAADQPREPSSSDRSKDLRAQIDRLQTRLLTQYAELSLLRQQPHCQALLGSALTNYSFDALQIKALRQATRGLCTPSVR